MSYDIYIVDPETKDTIQFDESHDAKGGTYAVGGTTEAWLNITYNYAKFFYDTIDKEEGIRWLYNKSVANTIPTLRDAIEKLDEQAKDFVYVKPPDMKFGEVVHKSANEEDYWASTPKNAADSLRNLVRLATLAPHGVWDGD